MAIHADNCWRDQATDACRREKPFFHWRTHSAHLYLDSPGEGDGGFQGGEFYFADFWTDALHGGGRTVVAPRCGRLVAFSAGPENLHGVNPLDRGRRCALSVWMSTDAERAAFAGELQLASAVLDGSSTAVASAEPSPDISEYYRNCVAAAANGTDSTVLDEVQREVAGHHMTFQVLHEEPQLTRVLGFLTAREVEQLINFAKPRMAPSLVYEGEQLTTMNYRTSETAWLTDADVEKVIDRDNLSRRIELVTGLSLESAEDVQIAVYNGETQGKYEPHMDWGLTDPKDVRRDFDHKEAPGGRVATFLMFLNDVPSGGHTAFTSLGLHVKPRAGSALFWFNLVPGKTGGLGDVLTRHGGCPVLRGLKYISTKWIHERGNEGLLQLPADSEGGHLWRDWRNLTTLNVNSLQDLGVAGARVCDTEDSAGQCNAHAR
mmetsp:Transcript_32497/g.93552  ORF Transcript_32497/g.93552 Transcript_32497/m.93552 type:complete len:433 (-) Transcript_32497:44-1342(-)